MATSPETPRAKSDDLLHHLRAALGAAIHCIQYLAAVGCRDVVAEQLQADHDRRERIIEIMGNTARQRPSVSMRCRAETAPLIFFLSVISVLITSLDLGLESPSRTRVQRLSTMTGLPL